MSQFIWFGRQVDMGALRDYRRNGEGAAINNGPANREFNWNYNYHSNPFFVQQENSIVDTRDRVAVTGQAAYQFTPWLNASLRGSSDIFRFDIDEKFAQGYSNTGYANPAYNGGFRFITDYHNEHNTELLVNVNRDIMPSVVFNGMVGGNVRRELYNLDAATTAGINVPGIYNVSNAAITPTLTPSVETSEITGWMKQEGEAVRKGDILLRRRLRRPGARPGRWHVPPATGRRRTSTPQGQEHGPGLQAGHRPARRIRHRGRRRSRFPECIGLRATPALERAVIGKADAVAFLASGSLSRSQIRWRAQPVVPPRVRVRAFVPSRADHAGDGAEIGVVVERQHDLEEFHLPILAAAYNCSPDAHRHAPLARARPACRRDAAVRADLVRPAVSAGAPGRGSGHRSRGQRSQRRSQSGFLSLAVADVLRVRRRAGRLGQPRRRRARGTGSAARSRG